MIAHVRVLFCTFLIFRKISYHFQWVRVTKCKIFFGFHRQKYRAFPAPHSLADTVVPKALTQRLFRLRFFYGHSDPAPPCFFLWTQSLLPCVLCLPCRRSALCRWFRHTMSTLPPCCRRCRSVYGMQAHRLPCVVLSIKGGKTSFQFSILKWNHKVAAYPAAGADPVLCGHTLPALPPSLLRFYIGKRHSPAAAMPALRRRSTLPPLPAQVFAFLPSAAHAGARVCVCVCWLWSALPTLPPVLSTLPRLPCVIRNLKVNINFLSPQTRIK